MFTNQTFDFLKRVTQIYLPALAAAWFTSASTFHLNYQAEIFGTITAITVFLGALLNISDRAYVNATTPKRFEQLSFLKDENSLVSLSHSTYTTLKWIVLTLLPATSALVITVCYLWNISNGDLIAGGIAILTTLLGSMLGISTKNGLRKLDS